MNTTVTRGLALTAVYCQYALCSFLLKKGHPVLVGRIVGAAELRCPSCHTVSRYEV